MKKDNFQRLIQLADEIFDVKNDPDQLDINPKVMERLFKIHPNTVTQFEEADGPVVWLLIIPTTKLLMQKFLEKSISEKDLFELTPLNVKYDAIYLCSALVLEEFRRKGIIKKLAFESIQKIKNDHPIKSLFVWAFTEEGDLAAEKIAELVGLPLYKLV